MYKFQKLEGILILLYAYASYLLAEGLRLSGNNTHSLTHSPTHYQHHFSLLGIVAILFNGVTMAHYNFYNLSRQSQESTKIIVQTIASMCEMFVFAYLGLALFSLKQSYDVVLILGSIVWTPPPTRSVRHSNTPLSQLCCLISRAFNIVPLSFLINLIRGKSSPQRIPYSHQIVLWFAGTPFHTNHLHIA